LIDVINEEYIRYNDKDGNEFERLALPEEFKEKSKKSVTEKING